MKMARFARIAGARDGDGDSFKQALIRLGEIAPALPYLYARSRLHGEKYRKYVQAVIRALLGQPEGVAADVWFHQERRRCAWLVPIDEELLIRELNQYEGQIFKRAQGGPHASLNLRRLGEMATGRRFISAYLLRRLLERMTA